MAQDHLAAHRRDARDHHLAHVAFEVGTHAPLGEYDQPTAATKNISGWFVTNGNLYWNLKKNGPQ